MSYLNESGLSTYDSNLKEWISSQNSKTISSSIYPWTKTAKAGAVSCYPVGGTELKPVVDFLFTEVPPASGDKGPENPSTISGVSSVNVTRCGKNLCPNNIILNSQVSFVTITSNADGSIKFNGTVASAGALLAYIFNATASPKRWPSYIKHATTYTFSVIGDNQNVNLAVYRSYNNGGGYGGNSVKIHAGETATWTTPASEPGLIIRIEIPAGTVLDNVSIKFQIEEGSSATEFEPYAGTDYTLPLGSTYYGGSIDLATGVMTVTWAGESVDIFNSVNSVYDDTVLFIYHSTYYHLGNTSNISRYLTCDKFVTGYNVYASECCRFTGPTSSNNKGVGFVISKTRLNVSGAVDPSAPTNAEWLAAANAWLANNPIFVCYRLFIPSTVQLTPTSISSLTQTDKYTPRLNTVYTDASAVQVGYVKSPIREEQELTQAIVSQGGNV